LECLSGGIADAREAARNVQALLGLGSDPK
jgi:hypothetical protein